MVNGSSIANATLPTYFLAFGASGRDDFDSLGCWSNDCAPWFKSSADCNLNPALSERRLQDADAVWVDGGRYFSNSSSPARWVAFTTALISVTRNFPSSSSRMPSMVHPAGVVTASFSSAG